MNDFYLVSYLKDIYFKMHDNLMPYHWKCQLQRHGSRWI